MDIRSITLFCEPHLNPTIAAEFVAEARSNFNYPVQSIRLATTPFPEWWGEIHESQLTARTREIATQWQEAGVNYISLGPVQLRHDAGWLEMIPALLSATDSIFVTAEIADTSSQIDLDRCHRLADIIRRVSTILDNGFGNLYLAALANCPPGSPFFPVAYHGGGPAAFAVAVESADLALEAIEQSNNLEEARTNLSIAIEQAAQNIMKTAETLAAVHNVSFGGIDFSLAPFPSPNKSLAGAMEALGLAHTGAPGSLFAAAFITEAIDRAKFHRCGFSGLMLPVLEDSVLAHRAGEGVVTVNDLLSYAAVCGVGLDTIPLPGDISQANLAGILLDVAALATRLNKPLTARLMPLPGMVSGDQVRFDFPYFADSRVMRIDDGGISNFLAQPTRLNIRKR